MSINPNTRYYYYIDTAPGEEIRFCVKRKRVKMDTNYIQKNEIDKSGL
jgi:hypothetical protein